MSFQAITEEAPRLLIRAQRADVAQPLPQGPTLGRTETLGQPRPVPSSSVDPDIVSRWIGGSPDIVEGGHPVMVGSGGSAYGPMGWDSCGSVCCDPCGSPCCDSCCGGCGGCCKDRGSFWFGGEYLLWALKRDNVPALVTVNSQGLLPSTTTPGTTTIFGPGPLDMSPFSGGSSTPGSGAASARTWALRRTCSSWASNTPRSRRGRAASIPWAVPLTSRT